MKKFTLLFLVSVLLVVMHETQAQNFKDHNWYFGNSPEAIRFKKSNNDPAILKQQATPFGTGGSAVATDPLTGDLLFYTDGENVYDASHQLMYNGDNLGAKNDISQPVAISPVPGKPGQYYIFSNDPSATAVPNVQVSIVDMTLSGNAGAEAPSLGEVVQKQVATGVLSTAEAMTVIKGNGPEDYILLVQDGTAIKSYKIENTLPLQGAPNSINEQQIAAGNFVHNPTNNTIAVIPANENANIKLYEFDPATGGLTVLDTIQNSAKIGELLYDAAWSPDGKTLYFSRSSTANTTTGQIYQYHEDLAAPQPVLESPVYRSYGLQTGPDGRLYHLYLEENNNIFKLGRIDNPNENDSLIYTLWQKEINFNGRQFPQFIPQEDFAFELVTFIAVDTCANSRTRFIPRVKPQADSLVWAIADTTINAFSPELTFEAGGTIPVSLTAYLNGKDSTYTRDVIINDNDLQITLPSDTTVCATAFPGFQLTAEIEGGSGGEQLVWSHGQTGATATFDSTGTYYVVAENANGCKTYASVNIKICQEEKRVGNIWYFGDRAGIDFNPEQPVAIPDSSVMNAPAGASAISDRNGQILFYTDGATVWNKEHEIMLNGTAIGGNPNSTQSALVVPFPGDATKYYVFTTDLVHGDQTYDLRYSMVDIMADETRGAVELASKASLLFSKSTEKITAVEKGDTTWLLMHELGNNTFRAYPISAGGIGVPVLSSEGSDHTSGSAGNAKGYLKFSTDGSRIAAAVQGPPSFVELFNFDDSTGTISDPLKIDFNGEEAYGIEFSPDNRKLYIATNASLYQYHISDTLTNEEVLASKKKIEVNASSALGALQLGPNGQIYLAQDGADKVLVINGPNTLETDTSHVSINPFDLEGAVSRLGLPNFVQSIMEPISDGDFSFEGQCLGDYTQFAAMGRCDTDQFEWVIKNAQNNTLFRSTRSKNTSLSYQFLEPGVYDVSLIISNPCAIPADTVISKDVVINAPPAEPDFPAVIGLCDGSETLTAGPVSDELEYLWSTGATENEIEVTKLGTYTVTIFNTVTGCSTAYSTKVENAGPQIDLGEDLFYCQGDRELFLDGGNALGGTYAWEIIDMDTKATVSTGAKRRIDIATAKPGTFKYTVTVTSKAPFNCVTKDSVLVTINPAPMGNTVGSAIAACNSTDGKITLDITSDGNYFYEVFDASNASLASEQSVDKNDTPIEVADNLGPGLYYIMLTDNVTGCTTRLNATIESSDPNQFSIASIPTVQANCNNEATVKVAAPQAAIPISYILSGTTVEGLPYHTVSSGTISSLNFNIPAVPAGTYTVEVTDANGCKATAEAAVTPYPEIPLIIERSSDNCEGPAVFRVENTTNFQFLWENISSTDPAEGFAGNRTNANAAITLPGTYKLTRTEMANQACAVDTTFEVNFPAPLEFELILGDDCLGERTVTVVPSSGSGNYSYLWATTGERTSTITAKTSRTYSVEVIDKESGCVVEKGIAVLITPKVTVSLSSEPACGDDEMIILRAKATPQNVIYSWKNSAGPIDQGTNLEAIKVSHADTYSVTVGRGGCEASAEIRVQRNLLGQSTLPETTIIICPSSADPKRSAVYLNPDSLNSFTRFRWEKDREFFSNEKVIKPQAPGLYKVTMTNIDGCMIEDEVKVVLSCQPILFVPNAIRPDSQIGDNRTFKIFTEDEIADEGFQVYIFNRWGEMVYQSKDKHFEWDGTFKGNPVPVSAYSYVIYYKGKDDPSDKVYQLQGGVTVLK